MNIEPCCDTQDSDPHDWGECLLIYTGQPGRDRAAYLDRLAALTTPQEQPDRDGS